MSQKKEYHDLQKKGAKVLREFAMEIVGSAYIFRYELAKELNCEEYTARRYMRCLKKQLLLDCYNSFEQAIKTVLDRCENTKTSKEIVPEMVTRNRARYEAEFFKELREIHDEAVHRYIH